jgi:septal ring factor EnvC (AmiA/AmiB activator)
MLMNTQAANHDDGVVSPNAVAVQRADPRTRGARWRSKLGVSAFVLAALVAALMPSQARADNHIAAKITEVAQQLDTLEHEQASADDALQSAVHLQSDLDDRLAQLQVQMDQAQESRQEVARQVNSIAATAYMSGQLPTAMSLVFAGSPRQLIDGAYDLASLSSNTNHVLKQVQNKQAELALLAAQVTATKAQQASVVAEATALRDRLQAKVLQERTLLASLKAQQRIKRACRNSTSSWKWTAKRSVTLLTFASTSTTRSRSATP